MSCDYTSLDQSKSSSSFSSNMSVATVWKGGGGGLGTLHGMVDAGLRCGEGIYEGLTEEGMVLGWGCRCGWVYGGGGGMLLCGMLLEWSMGWEPGYGITPMPDEMVDGGEEG